MSRPWLVAGGALVIGAWALGAAGPPVYDGLSNPDEPYRYVAAPAGYRHTPPPTDAKADVPFGKGLSGNAYASSDESGPQISIFIGQGALQGPATVKTVTIVATPDAPKPPLPTDGTVVSNVYHVSALSQGVEFRPKTAHYTPSYISMRAPSGKQPGPVFGVRDSSGHWTELSTQRTGFDIYAALFTQFGDYALVQLTHPHQTSSSGKSSGGGGVNGALIGIGAGVVALGVVVGLIRLRRLRAT